MARRINKKIFEVRLRFEYGEDLNKLALEYRIPLSTINKRKAKDAAKGEPWIKGYRAQLPYEEYVEGIEQRKQRLCNIIDDKARQMVEHLETLFDKKTDYENKTLDKIKVDEEYSEKPDYVYIAKAGEEGYNLRLNFIERYVELRKKIEKISSEDELLDLERKKLDIELKKIEVEDKKLELKIKKAENRRLLRKV